MGSVTPEKKIGNQNIIHDNSALNEHYNKIEEYFSSYLPGRHPLKQPLFDAMRYACVNGGKRIRGILLLEFCRICGGNTNAALPFALAIEMIHSYSLVHDDLPCMDNSPLRRGKPSTHAKFGETTALLAGDALLNLAFETVLSEDAASKVGAEQALKAARILADKAGINGMIGGQTIDLDSEGKTIDLATLETLQREKTAALIIAACQMGVVVSGNYSEEQLKAAEIYGLALGLCFQIIDDILDVTASAEALGKPVGSDSENEKSTYVTLLGIDEAKKLAAEKTAAAIRSLDIFNENEIKTDNLVQLAKVLFERKK